MPWEDRLVRAAVYKKTHGGGYAEADVLVKSLSLTTQRTVNAILCRIERNHGGYVRKLFEEDEMNVEVEHCELFWCCWVKGGGLPAVKHLSFEDASIEAKRLQAHTGKLVYVLRSIGYMEPPLQPAAVWHDL